MNAIVNNDTVHAVFNRGENSAITGQTTNLSDKSEGLVNLDLVRPLGQYRADIFQLFALVFTILYFAGGVTLAGAILYYTIVSAKILP